MNDAKPTIILASASIGRRQLLEKLGVPFTVTPSTINEDLITDQNPYKMLQLRARAKAEDVVKKMSSWSEAIGSQIKQRDSISRAKPSFQNDFIIIAADSMAILDGKTFGKAKNQADAKRIVAALMGKTHVFATATCFIYTRNPSHPPLALRGRFPSLRLREGQDELRSEKFTYWESLTQTRVTLRTLDPSSLALYLSRYDFTRFAAGYTLNETPWDLVTSIDGSYTNVIGLPFEVILPILRNLKLL